MAHTIERLAILPPTTELDGESEQLRDAHMAVMDAARARPATAWADVPSTYCVR